MVGTPVHELTELLQSSSTFPRLLNFLKVLIGDLLLIAYSNIAYKRPQDAPEIQYRFFRRAIKSSIHKNLTHNPHIARNYKNNIISDKDTRDVIYNAQYEFPYENERKRMKLST